MIAVAPSPVITVAPTAPTMPTTNTRTKIRICSVYPVRKSTKLKHSVVVHLPPKPDGSDGGYGLTCDTEYVIEAAPRDGYSLAEIFDALQPIIGHSEDGPSENTMVPGHIPVQVVANALVNSWAAQTQVAKQGFKPGIGIIAGEFPTAGELSALREQQRAFFEFLVQDGNDKFLNSESTNITNIHRSSAHWLLGEAAQQLPWVPKMEQRSVKDCPRCAKQILAAALGCEHCSLDLVEWYEKYPTLTPDPHVALFLETVRVGVENAALKSQKAAGAITYRDPYPDPEGLLKSKEPRLAQKP